MITIIKADDVILPITFKDSDGVAIDITGATIFFTVKKYMTDSDDDAIIKKDVTTHNDAPNGETQIILSNTDTDVDPNTYYWDLQIKDASGKINSTQRDKLQILDGVTIRTA